MGVEGIDLNGSVGTTLGPADWNKLNLRLTRGLLVRYGNDYDFNKWATFKNALTRTPKVFVSPPLCH